MSMHTSWMSWLEIKHCLIGVIALCSLVGFGCKPPISDIRPQGRTQPGTTEEESADGRPRWKFLRTFAVGEVWATSPDGKYIATIDDQRVRLTTSLVGPVLHHAALPIVAHDLVLTKSSVICYKRLDPAATIIAVLDIKSGKWTRFDTKASIWQMTADAAGDGIWVSCSDHTVRHYPDVRSGAIGVTQLNVPGYGGMLSAEPSGCIVSEVLPAGITAISNDATMRWHIDEENPKRVSRVITTQCGAIYIDSTVRSNPNGHTITRIDGSTGAPLWETEHSGKIVTAAADQKSGMLSVSVGNPGSRVPAKLFVYSANGTVIMDGRGSGYFSPMLVGITDGGHRITVIDGQRGLTTLSESGSTLARRVQLPNIAPDVINGPFCRLSVDDRFLFIQTATNQIQILEALHGE
ncbi:MAG: hypothetical protein ACKO14_11860 [Armatimonadota bacterium]